MSKIKTCPNLLEERKLWKKGFKYVVGLDEAGRGPLAGPVVAAAVMMVINPKSKALNPKQILNSKFKCSKHVLNFGHLDLKLRDSKKLTSKARDNLYKILTTHPGILWGLGRVSERVIDKINILEATKLAMKKAIEKLKVKSQKLKVDFLVIDGNFKLDLPTLRQAQGGERSRTIPQKSIVKGDEKVFSCAAASILAKVTRDRLMGKYDKKYPHYGFDKHKGYPTKFHLKMLRKHKPCQIHRKSFRPVLKISKIKNKKSKIQIKN